jgi:hypothetical protein
MPSLAIKEGEELGEIADINKKNNRNKILFATYKQLIAPVYVPSGFGAYPNVQGVTNNMPTICSLIFIFLAQLGRL